MAVPALSYSNAHMTDITYARRGERELIGTLYQPAGAGPFPAVVSVHGGAWTSGDRFGTADLDEALRDAGVLVLAVDFRMPPEAAYPAAAQDVHAAIRWLKGHATELGTLPELVGIVGSSSGGQTAMLCALRPHDAMFAAESDLGVDGSVAFAVGCWPIVDPLARYRMARANGNAKLVAAHDAYFGTEAAMAAASPQRIVESGEAHALPPVLIVQGTADANVTPDMAQNFVDVYRRAGGSADLRAFAGQPHTFIKDGDPAAAAEAKRAVAAFVLIHGDATCLRS
jgi:acetyl esterase/lipase